MCRDFWSSDTAQKKIAQAKAITPTDLMELIAKGPVGTLTETQNLQPAISLMNALCLSELAERDIRPAAVAGHSLGELSACYAAGMLGFETFIKLATVRGRFMADAASHNDGTMVAVASEAHSEIHDLVVTIHGEGAVIGVANINSPKQMVVSGARGAISEFQVRATQEGFGRITELQVSGAWHSSFMKECQDPFDAVLNGLSLDDPQVPVISNVSATPSTSIAQAKSALVAQLSAPVQWLKTLRYLRETYPDAIFAEVGPGKVLTGLMLQTDPRGRIYQVNSRRGLDRLVKVLG